MSDPSEDDIRRDEESNRRTGTSDRRLPSDRRGSEVPVFLDRRLARDRRRTLDRRSDDFERMFLEQVATMQAQVALLEQRLAEGA
jgi:hypothetical protein